MHSPKAHSKLKYTTRLARPITGNDPCSIYGTFPHHCVNTHFHSVAIHGRSQLHILLIFLIWYASHGFKLRSFMSRMTLGLHTCECTYKKYNPKRVSSLFHRYTFDTYVNFFLLKLSQRTFILFCDKNENHLIYQ